MTRGPQITTPNQRSLLISGKHFSPNHRELPSTWSYAAASFHTHLLPL